MTKRKKRALAYFIVSIPILAMVAGIILANVFDLAHSGLAIDAVLGFIGFVTALLWAIEVLGDD